MLKFIKKTSNLYLLRNEVRWKCDGFFSFEGGQLFITVPELGQGSVATITPSLS
jgi:hypothetical protein